MRKTRRKIKRRKRGYKRRRKVCKIFGVTITKWDTYWFIEYTFFAVWILFEVFVFWYNNWYCVE